MGAALNSSGSGGRSRRGRRRVTPMAEINVTPFVDVMLVLLIIFMVAAPLLTTGVPVELPETNAEALPTDSEDEPLLVSIDRAGVVYLQREPQVLETLQPKLAAIREARGKDGGKVFLRADAEVSHGYVQRVLAMLQQARFTSIGIVHDQAAEAAAPATAPAPAPTPAQGAN